jgi:hypothetical protein
VDESRSAKIFYQHTPKGRRKRGRQYTRRKEVFCFEPWGRDILVKLILIDDDGGDDDNDDDDECHTRHIGEKCIRP